MGTGIVKLLTIGGFGIWYLIDLIMTLAGATRDKQGLALVGRDQGKNKMIAWIVSGVVLILSMGVGGNNVSNNLKTIQANNGVGGYHQTALATTSATDGGDDLQGQDVETPEASDPAAGEGDAPTPAPTSATAEPTWVPLADSTGKGDGKSKSFHVVATGESIRVTYESTVTKGQSGKAKFELYAVPVGGDVADIQPFFTAADTEKGNWLGQAPEGDYEIVVKAKGFDSWKIQVSQLR